MLWKCYYCQRKLFAVAKMAKKETENLKEIQHCKACGRDVNRLQYYYTCQNCKEFHVCQNCRVCSQYHFLAKVFNLQAIDARYGPNQKYNCDICQITKTLNDSGVWHCRQCQFDACTDCLE